MTGTRRDCRTVAIGLEFATVWNSYGSQVTLVEMLDRIAPLEDEEVSKQLERSFKKGETNNGSRVSHCRIARMDTC